MVEKRKILIYGATGYTGKLFSKYLVQNKLNPILGGRSKSVQIFAQELGCEARIFGIDSAAEHINDIDIIVNLAGPFAITQTPLIEACIKTKTHYLDIAGEVSEVMVANQFHNQALQAGLVIIPAAGFGVAPTDIAAKLAIDKIENPTNLTISYATKGGASRGTLKTVLKDIHKEGVRLENGVFHKAMPASKELETTVFNQRFKAVYNPWRADLFTARISTGVQNIETYSEFPGFVVKMMKGKLGWLRKLILNRLISLMPEGPNEKQLNKGKTLIQAIAKNQNGEISKIEMEGPEAYLFTIYLLHGLLEQLALNKEKAGFCTPSHFGTEWIRKIDQVKIKP